MRKALILLLTLCLTGLITSGLIAQYRVKYVKKYYDPVLEEMREKAKKEKEERDKITAEIRQRQKERKEKERQEAIELRFDFTGVQKPASPEVFKSAFHFPPVAQYRTGTCWSFSTTSFLESEAYRLTGQKIKLSEMHTVYYEYLAKVRRYIQERGDSELGEGSEANAVTRIWKECGAVPREVYPGLVGTDERYDHAQMFEEIENYLKYVNDHNYWDEEQVLATVRVILNKYMGVPPSFFEYQGKIMTPLEFLHDVLKINPDDYLDVMSTLSVPFYTKGEFKVPDNWWHSADYYNVPLEEWYSLIKKAVTNGYTVAIGGDVSEPGYNGFEDAAIVPEFDIPRKYINQDAREFRFYNKTTGDDHGVHLVGYTRVGDYDWFLIKDSARSARHGKFEGYYFYREDYIKLKMLTFMVHKDVMKDVLKKFK
ncbi:MAG: peptidase C1 [candidate division KSB1 bacterium]|nr:peptidase C1 [candidate division KSB1 bacterium]